MYSGKVARKTTFPAGKVTQIESVVQLIPTYTMAAFQFFKIYAKSWMQ